MPHRRSPVTRIDACVQQAVERHGRRTRGNHRYHDPSETPPKPLDLKSAVVPGKQRARERKRKRKNRVLEFDHFERQTQSFPKGAHSPVALSFYGIHPASLDTEL